MVFASPESTAEAGQLRSAVAGQSDSVSSIMFNEARDYQVASQANSVGRGGNSDSNSANSDNSSTNNCLSVKDIQKMLNGFKIEDKNSEREIDKFPGKPLGKPGSKPWSPEFGVCAPGSPYKIDCHDDKEQKLRTK